MADQNAQQRLEELARKYLKVNISPAELDAWFAESTSEEQQQLGISRKAYGKQLPDRIHAESGIGQTRRL